MPAGRPPKPIEERIRLGNPGKRPIPKPLALMPAAESGSAVRTYRTGRDLIQGVIDGGATWIGPTDATAARLIELWDDMQEARTAWRETRTNVNFNAYVGLSKEVTACLSQLGLDPASRGRLGLAQVKAATQLSGLQERLRAGRQGS